MGEERKGKKIVRMNDTAMAIHNAELVKRLFELQGMDALNSILSREDPGKLVRGMTRVDLFWFIKKIGEGDSLPLLNLASVDQWQYLLDMDLWLRDRIDPGKTFTWLERLFIADESRFIRWLINDGNLLIHQFFYHNLQVELKTGDDDPDLPESFFTLDDLYFIRILDLEHREVIEKILRAIAREDSNYYQALLLGLTGVIPVEVEEEMYRLRGVRLAEDGFLPFEEALSVYSYEKADLLKPDDSPYKVFLPENEASREMIPLIPLGCARDNTLLTTTLSGISDNVFLDRLRLEFGGLCNQLLSADGIVPDDLDTLKKTSMKAGAFINMGLEKVSGGSIPVAEQFLKMHPLITIFRAGFGLALELKWDYERWMKQSWYLAHGLNSSFWGDAWGGVLSGIIMKRPLFFVGVGKADEYRDFEDFSEIDGCRKILHRLIVLDNLLRALYTENSLDRKTMEDPLISFHPLFFNFWARGRLELDPGFQPLSIEDAGNLFRLLRHGEKRPPFTMEGGEDLFIGDLISCKPDTGAEDILLLMETLSMLWQRFVDEYAHVSIDDLDERFSRLLVLG